HNLHSLPTRRSSDLKPFSMAGPIVRLMPGYNSSRACAKTWADECQKAFFPSLSFQVKSVKLPSSVKGVVVSTVVLLNEAESTFLAKPSLILCATSNGVVPCGYSRLLPSGNVMTIMLKF